MGGCNWNPSGVQGVATWTPTVTSTPTCVPDAPLSTPEGWSETSRLIIFLYDPRVSADNPLGFENGEETHDVSVFLRRVIPKIMRPGDQVAVFQLGYSEYDAARITRVYSYTNLPALYNTPSPGATLTPLPPTKFPTPGYDAVATKNFISTETSKREAIEAADKAFYECQVQAWNRDVRLTATVWHTTATAEVVSFQSTIDTAFEVFLESPTKIEEPFQTNEEFYGGVYYGLSFSTIVFDADCRKHGDCILVIIDDLEIWGRSNPENLHINLSDVRIFEIMPNCDDIDKPACSEARDYWHEEFRRLGVSDTPEYWNGDRAEINLLNEIGR